MVRPIRWTAIDQGMTSSPDSAAKVVEEITSRYREMRTYRDQGVVRRQIDCGSPPLEMPFETAFCRPTMFRFAFRRPHPHPNLRHLVTRFVVGCDGNKSYFYESPSDGPVVLRVEDDLSRVVASATGISGGAAHTIARLLEAVRVGFRLLELQDLRSMGDFELDGVLCHRIAGVHPRGERCLLLVEQKSLLLRTLSVEMGDLGLQEVERQAIRVDELLDPSTFRIPGLV